VVSRPYERETLGTKYRDYKFQYPAPDNVLFLDYENAFDFSKALRVLHTVPKTESNFYRRFKPALTTFLTPKQNYLFYFL